MSWVSLAARAWGVGSGLGLFGPLLRELSYFTSFNFPNQLPTPDMIVEAYRKGWINSAVVDPLCKVHGVRGPAETQPANVDSTTARTWKQVWESQRWTIDPQEAYRLYKAHAISNAEKDRIWQMGGLWNDDGREQLVKSFNTNIPGAETIIHFAVREAFDDAVARRFDYDAEFPPALAELMDQIGWGGRPNLDPGGGGNEDGPTWAKLHWRAHWQTISPSQAYEMFQRLRPNRIARFGNQVQGLRPFSFQDLATVLRIADYPTPFRAQLAAVAYRKPRLIDIDRFYRTGLIDAAEALELHLDQGYNPADAELRVQWLTRQRSVVPSDREQKQSIEQLVQLYTLGQLPREETLDKLIRIISQGQFTLQSQPPANPNQRRVYDEVFFQARRRIEQADAGEEIKMTRRMLSVWRKRFLGGVISEAQLVADMASQDFQRAFVVRFVQRLKLELAGGKLLLSTAKVRELVMDGVLPFGTAKSYLTNLGWKEPELSWILSQLQSDLRLAEQQELERQAADAESRARAQERQLRAIEQMKAKVQRRLTRQASDAQLKRFFVRGIINEQTFRQELAQRNILAAAIERRVADARIDREKYLARRTNRPAPGPAPGPAPAP